MLNYVKNEYIMELQNKSFYLPNIFIDSNIREQLKWKVDKILMKKVEKLKKSNSLHSKAKSIRLNE